MPRGFLITPEVKTLIVVHQHNNPRWKPKDVHMVVRNTLRDRVREDPSKYADLALKLEREWPSLASVRKIMKENKFPSHASSEPALAKDKDKPWNLATLLDPEYSIPPEAIPVVMSFYKKRLAKDEVLTIREALWIARLYKLVEPLDLVLDWAFLYSVEELMAEQKWAEFDTGLDLKLIDDPEYASRIKREIDIWKIATKYKADAMKLAELNLSIDETEEAAKTGKYYWNYWNEPEAPK